MDDGEFPAKKGGVILGHETAGVVLEVGSDVHHVKPGDRVGVDPNLSACGRVCGPCSKAQYNFCTKMDVGYTYGIHMNGGFAEKVVVEGAQVYPFPPDLKPENSFLCETLSCVNYGRGKLGILDQDANILILGAGVVGLMWGCLLHHEGKRNLTISEPSEIRRNTAKKLDVFKDVFTPEELAKTYQGQKFVFDVVIDACGVAVAVERSVSLMRKGGTLVIFACAPPSQNVSLNLFQVYERELKVQGVLTNPYSYGKTVPLVLAMQEQCHRERSHRAPLKGNKFAVAMDPVFYRGEFPCKKNGVILGHEIAGTVLAAGSEVFHVKPGDVVGVDPNSSGCGNICENCSKGLPHICLNVIKPNAIGVKRHGGFADKMVAEGSQVYPFPPDLKPENGFLVETLSCIYHGREKLGSVDPGSDILILGSGVVGLMWASLLHHQGQRNLTISEPRESRRNTAKKLDVFKDIFTPEELNRTYQGQECVFDIIIDCCGVAAAIEQTIPLIKKCGTLLCFACAAPSQIDMRGRATPGDEREKGRSVKMADPRPKRIDPVSVLCVICVALLSSLEPVATEVPPGSVDLVDALQMVAEPLGVTPSVGICPNRAQRIEQGEPVYGEPDLAWDVASNAILTVPTAHLFPVSFPTDFSLLLTIKLLEGRESTIFSLYSDSGVEQLSLRSTAENVTLIYKDSSSEGVALLFTKRGVSDGEWHRLAVSVKGNSVTVIFDCDVQETLELVRDEIGMLTNTGLIVVGQHLIDGRYFEGSIQQFYIIPTPDAAYEQCNFYCPDCNRPLEVRALDFTPINRGFQEFNQSLTISEEGSGFVEMKTGSEYHDYFINEVTNERILRGPRGYPGPPGERGYPGPKGEPGRDGRDGTSGIPGPAGHVFMIPIGSGNEKGPDSNMESMRQMLAQHMMSMQGPRGPQGLTGLPGEQGAMGPEGIKGEPGDIGEQWKANRPDTFTIRVPVVFEVHQVSQGAEESEEEVVEMESEALADLQDQRENRDYREGLGSLGRKETKECPEIQEEKEIEDMKAVLVNKGFLVHQVPPEKWVPVDFWDLEDSQEPQALQEFQGQMVRKGQRETLDPKETWDQWVLRDNRVPWVHLVHRDSWERRVSRQGAPGKPGLSGLPGTDGLPGHNGNPGMPGEKGDKGDVGPQGATGFPGLRGQKGDQGIRGPLGNPGDKGEPGQEGEKGELGQKGERGSIGPPGLIGQEGPEGPKGFNGPPGERGPPGPLGEKGKPGSPGFPGYPGPPGDKGEKGTDGEPGMPGDKGERGLIGIPGERGIPGPRVRKYFGMSDSEEVEVVEEKLGWMDPKEKLVSQDHQGLLEKEELKGLKVPEDLMDPWDRLATMGKMDLSVHQEKEENREHLDHPARLDLRESLDLRDPLENLDLRATQVHLGLQECQGNQEKRVPLAKKESKECLDLLDHKGPWDHPASQDSPEKEDCQVYRSVRCVDNGKFSFGQ
ncbi:unnamed protein product [Cyprideis torosa]|uniref:Thrombospondin-like N-terminal domain-containing protein n=1 Tax=Cyprideis torosa TaxID=163714 RepID=A0A7R8WEE4_9CRUS|nr:unnamed protein product [Cyprideis torosa]CAG0890628.1 unnamed protein product [Cyprideis torosa]